jgi:hypothetical protein
MFRLGLLSIVTLVGCAPSEDQIQEEIDEASYCATAGECVDVGTECPFGCNILVNAAEVDRIRGLLEDHDESCAYDCMAPTIVVCTAGRCGMAQAQ